MSQQQQPRRRHGWGFEDNDPMLPRQDSRPEFCIACDGWHRPDLGCPRQLRIPPWLATLFGITFVVVLAVLWSKAVCS